MNNNEGRTKGLTSGTCDHDQARRIVLAHLDNAIDEVERAIGAVPQQAEQPGDAEARKRRLRLRRHMSALRQRMDQMAMAVVALGEHAAPVAEAPAQQSAAEAAAAMASSTAPALCAPPALRLVVSRDSLPDCDAAPAPAPVRQLRVVGSAAN